jgi:hypothetical protein
MYLSIDLLQFPPHFPHRHEILFILPPPDRSIVWNSVSIDIFQLEAAKSVKSTRDDTIAVW